AGVQRDVVVEPLDELVDRQRAAGREGDVAVAVHGGVAGHGVDDQVVGVGEEELAGAAAGEAGQRVQVGAGGRQQDGGGRPGGGGWPGRAGPVGGPDRR